MAKRRGSKQTAHYVLDGTERTIEVGVVEQVLWEKAHKGQAFYDGTGAVHFERTAWTIWSGSKRKGQHELQFDDWLRSIDDAWMDEPDAQEDDGLTDPPDGSGTGN